MKKVAVFVFVAILRVIAIAAAEQANVIIFAAPGTNKDIFCTPNTIFQTCAGMTETSPDQFRTRSNKTQGDLGAGKMTA